MSGLHVDDSAMLDDRAGRNGASAAHECKQATGQMKGGRPYPEDLRSRVIAAIENGASYREAAAQCGVSASVAMKWAQFFRQTGSVAAKPMGGDRRSRLKREQNWILTRIAAEPALTPTELHRELRARGIRVAYLTVQRFLKKQRIDAGKSPHAGQPGTGQSQQKDRDPVKCAR